MYTKVYKLKLTEQTQHHRQKPTYLPKPDFKDYGIRRNQNRGVRQIKSNTENPNQTRDARKQRPESPLWGLGASSQPRFIQRYTSRKINPKNRHQIRNRK